MRRTIRQSVLMTAAALGVMSCGGGGGDSQLAGIDRLGVSSGSISGFGSIFVNGVEWNTNGAAITVDGSPGFESDLRIGQVVKVRGRRSADGTTGTADSVEFDNSVAGPIASRDLAAGSFVVLGQTVRVSADTEFDDSIPAGADGQRDLNDLAVDDVVEVSGYRDADDAIRATRVELRGGAGGLFQVKGTVSSLDASTFQIGSLVVNYASATLDDFGGDTLSNGDVVEVKGTFAANVFTATVVEREDVEGSESGDDREVEGYITRFVSPTDFDVAGIKVTTNSRTDYEGGTAADLALNVKVEVEGEVNAAGVLVADEIEIRVQPEDADVEIEGDIDAVNAAAGTVTLQGLDIIIKVNAVTRLKDESSAGLENFSLANLVTGDHIEVRAAEDGSTPSVENDVIATRLERRDARNEVSLEGAIQDENPPEFTVLGVRVVTDFADFYDDDDNSITAGEFFSAVGPGDVVKAKTDALGVSANILTADEVEIE